MFAIAAISLNNVLGYENSIPWDIIFDRFFFNLMTKNQNIVMGRKTFENIGKIKSDINYYVLSRQDSFGINKIKYKNVKVIKKTSEIKYIKNNKEIWICGGKEIYDQLLKFCDLFYLTIVKKKQLVMFTLAVIIKKYFI